MSFVVKNTAFYGPLDLLCPHTCRGCGALGAPLCECCKNYISTLHMNICPRCHKEVAKDENRCFSCKNLPFETAFVYGFREGLLSELIKEYKYRSVRDLAGVFAEFYAEMIPEDFGGGKDVVVVPLPTISRHIRERGFDHMLKVGKKLARMRGFKCWPVISRMNKTVQVGANEEERRAQAKGAYAVLQELDADKIYLLIDDVWTTGASMLSACEKMQAAGAKNLAAAVLAVNR